MSELWIVQHLVNRIGHGEPQFLIFTLLLQQLSYFCKLLGVINYYQILFEKNSVPLCHDQQCERALVRTFFQDLQLTSFYLSVWDRKLIQKLRVGTSRIFVHLAPVYLIGLFFCSSSFSLYFHSRKTTNWEIGTEKYKTYNFILLSTTKGTFMQKLCSKFMQYRISVLIAICLE